MYSEIAKNEQEIKEVLENLCDDTILELTKIFGQNYKKNVFNQIKQLTTKYLIKLKLTGKPVGLFGLIRGAGANAGSVELSAGGTTAGGDTAVAGIFLLTTNELHNGNKITFLKRAKAQIKEWFNEYDLIMDYCYKKNFTIQKWLRLLGFKPSEYQDDDFQIYYKGNIGLYNE